MCRRVGLLVLAVGLVAVTATVAGRVEQPRYQAAAPPSVGKAAAGAGSATESEALAAARRSGRRVEVAAGRGERVTLFANPDGTLTREHYSRPIRAYRGGRWLPIDTTLVRFGNGRVGPKAASTVMSFSGGGAGPLVILGHAGQQVSMSWLNTLPPPRLQGSTATYREVLPGVDLVIHADEDGFSHVLVVKTPQAARDSRLRSIEFGLHSDGVRLRAQRDRLVGVDGNGDALFEAPVPKMWDAGDGDGEPTRTPPESAKRGRMGLRVVGDRMVLTPDPVMMAGTGVRFPLYLDPFTRSTSKIDWAMVDSGYPNEEYWHWDGDRDQRVGLCPPDPTCNSSKVKRLFFTFDTSYYTSTAMNIVEANFLIPLKQVSYPSETHNVDLYLMTSGGISAATNWNNQPNGSGWSGAEYQSSNSSTAALGGDCTASPTPNLAFPAKAAVEKRWSGILLGLKSAEELNNHAARRFCDNAVLAIKFNRVPNAPTNLTADRAGPCRTGAPYQYADRPPTLNAILSDPDTEDAEPLTAEWVVTWSGGSKTWHDGQARASGSLFPYPLNDAANGVPTLPENTVISYKVRANDGVSWGPYGGPCEFMIDRTSPAGPDIDSPQYLPLDQTGPGEPSASCVPDSAARDGVGVAGTFTFKSSSTDVTRYDYTISSPVGTSVPLTTVNVPAGAPATVTWMPEVEGPHVITVRAIDQAGRSNSNDSSCTFVVKPGRPAIASWALADPPGSTQAVDSAGNANPAVSGGAVNFGATGPDGVPGRAAVFTGSATSYLAPARLGLVNTSASFSVSAWANVPPGTETASQTIVSQEGSGEYGFALGYDGSGKWYFSIATSDGIAWSAATLQGPAAVAGVWTHLVGVYNPTKQQMTLQADGEAVYSRTIRTSWHAQRALHIGRKFTRTGYAAYFRGAIAEVAVFDRVVPPAEAVRLAATRTGYWNFNSRVTPKPSPGYDVSPEYSDDPASEALGRAMGLRDGASLYLYHPTQFPPPEGPPALMGAGHLLLDRPGEYTSSVVGARTDKSFTVTARVQLSSACDASRPRMTVLSQPGTNASAFLLRCALVGATPRWQVTLNTADQANATGPTVTDTVRAPNTDAPGQHLAVVFDSKVRELRLYVDGQFSGSTRLADTHVVWDASAGGLQVGRAKVNGAWAEYLPGNVDDVRIYAGVLTATEIGQLADLTELPGN
jgi:hypothetical protein